MAWTQHVYSFLIGYCLLAASSALSWKKKPQSQSVAVGGNVTFHCELNDRGARTVIWHDSTYNILFQDGNRFNAPENYIIQGEFNLVITNIKKEDNRQFICNVKDLGLEAANLTVLLPPNPPSIEANATGNPYRENQVLGLTCKSRGGNPNPTIRWLKNGQVQLDNIINNPAPTIGGLTSSHLAIVLDRTDHQANYTCVVFNEVNAQNPLGTFQVLQVQYSPFITFAPFDDLLNIRDAADATLVCIVDANPPVSTVTWRKNGQPLTGVSKSRVFQPAIKSDTGEYMCIANNGINGAKNGTIMLNVIYPPVLTVPSSRTVEEGSSLNITCNYDANPEPYQVHWERISPGPFSVDNSRHLVFSRILRDNAGNYTCKAWSQLKISGEEGVNNMEQAFTYINVEYPPGSAFIRPVGDYNVGDSVELKCSASPEGFPAATFEWKKDGVIQAQNAATYRINNARLSDIGDYICTPQNKVGRGQSSTISLSVNEPPTLTESPNNAEIHVPLSDPNPIEIKCVAQGRPSPVISWFKNNDDVPLTTLYPSFYTIEQTNTTVNSHRFIITNILYFRGGGRNMTSSGQTRLRVEDIGNYTCRVEAPTHTATVSGRASVYVQFKPLVSLGQERVAVDVAETAALPCITRANPTPTFRWYRNKVEVSDGGRYSTRLEALGETAKYQSVLTIQDVTQGDLGGYTCRMENSFGNNSKPVTLSLKSAPEAPTGLIARSKTWESVSLTWNEGFDGGAPQDFFIRYSAGNDIKEVKVRPSGVAFFNVTKLTPHTSYLFFVYGRNNLGQGAPSYGIPVVTDELVIPSLDSPPSFDSTTHMLVVKIGLEPTYCLKVDIRTKETGSQWETVYPCLEMVSDSIEVPGQGVNAMNVSVCLKYRIDVCGSPMQAEISQPPSQGLTETDVIIIACVCAIIIVTLLTILVVFICRRRRNQAKDYASENPPRRPQPINGSVTNSQKTPQAYDNTGMTQLDVLELDDPSINGAFARDSSLTNINNGYGPLELKRNAYLPYQEGHLRPNGNIPHDTSYDSQKEKQIFENEMNRRNENNSKGSRPGELQFHGIPRSPTKEKYMDLEEKKEGSLQSGQESGYSTPDPNKPKKVIYEVVV
ncbi:nephrin-like isoform X1 [Haliotis cracherodii]|uniref:nephrin-like isoform X1 n=1 Tax=Haliotis cracherodii TaxID=6455 RepID=UPI0039EA6664